MVDNQSDRTASYLQTDHHRPILSQPRVLINGRPENDKSDLELKQPEIFSKNGHQNIRDVTGDSSLLIGRLNDFHSYHQTQPADDTVFINPKITIKTHYVKGGQQNARCKSGNPNGKKAKRIGPTIGGGLVKAKALSKGGDKIYRLPSISKCLEHEILPRSSLMLKQICEIASQNQGFIKSHFDEFIKKKAINMLAGKAHYENQPNGPIPSKNEQGLVNLQVDGKEKERTMPPGFKKRQQVGITNLQLTIESPFNMNNGGPVVLPQATPLNSSHQAGTFSQGVIYNQKRLLSQGNTPSGDPRRDTNALKITLPQDSQNPNLVNIDTKRNDGLVNVASHPDIEILERTLRENSLNSVGSAGRKKVYSSSNIVTQQQPKGTIKMYNGRAYYHSNANTSKPTMKSDGFAQTDKSNVSPFMDSGTIHPPPTLMQAAGKLARSISSANSSRDPFCLEGKTVIPMTVTTSGIGIPHTQWKAKDEYVVSDEEDSVNGRERGHSAIRVQNYQFKGVTSPPLKIGKRRSRKEGAHPFRNSTRESPFSLNFLSKNVLTPPSTSIPRNQRTGRDNKQSQALSQMTDTERSSVNQMMVSANSIVPQPQFDLAAAMERMALKSSNDLIAKYYLSPIAQPNEEGFIDPENNQIQPKPMKKSSTRYIKRMSITQRVSRNQSGSNSPERDASKDHTVTVTGTKIQLSRFEQRYGVKNANQQSGMNLIALAKKSVEVGDDNPISSWTRQNSRVPNTDDLAPVYLSREASARTFKPGPPTRLNQLLDGDNPQTLASSLRSSRMQKQQSHMPLPSEQQLERRMSQLPQDIERIEGLINATYQLVDSFQKNNVRRDMSHYTAENFLHGSPQGYTPNLANAHSQPIMHPHRTISRNDSQQVTLNPDDPAAVTEGFEKKPQSNQPGRTEIPQSALRSNPQISTITSIPSDITFDNTVDPARKVSNTTLNQGVTFHKHRENFTIILPLTGLKGIAPQKEGQAFKLVIAGQQPPHMLHTDTYGKIDTQRLITDDNDPLTPPNLQEVVFSKIYPGSIINNSNNMVMNSQQQSPGRIKSVFEEEKEAQQKGLIKEMIFVAPPNHEVPLETKKLSPNKSRQQKKISVHSPVQWIGLNQKVINQGRFSPKAPNTPSPPPQTLTDRAQTHRVMEPYTEVDDILSQKLMKDLMPSNYRLMKKRNRGGMVSNDNNNTVLSSSIDSTLRMPIGIQRRGFGIRKLDPKDIKDKQLRNSQFSLSGKNNFHLGQGQEDDRMQMISYCLGIAPSRYKMDVSHINNKLMALLDEKQPGPSDQLTNQARPQASPSEHNRASKSNLTSSMDPSALTMKEDIEIIREQLDVASPQIQQKQVKLTINEFDLRIGLNKMGSNVSYQIDQYTEELPNSQLEMSGTMTPTRIRSRAAESINQAYSKNLIVSGQAINSGLAGHHKKLHYERYKTGFIQRTGVTLQTRASNINLLQDLKDLREDNERFLISPKHNMGNGSMGLGDSTTNIQENTFDHRENSSRDDKSAIRQQEQDLGIKTLISITHHTHDQRMPNSSQGSPYRGVGASKQGSPHNERNNFSDFQNMNVAQKPNHAAQLHSPLGETLRMNRRKGTTDQELRVSLSPTEYQNVVPPSSPGVILSGQSDYMLKQIPMTPQAEEKTFTARQLGGTIEQPPLEAKYS